VAGEGGGRGGGRPPLPDSAEESHASGVISTGTPVIIMTMEIADHPATARHEPVCVNRPVPVVHIITKLELGGAQQNTLFTLSHLDRGRFVPYLIAGRGGLLDEEARCSDGLRTTWVPSLIREIRPVRDLWALLALRRQLIRIRREAGPVMIVHTHSSKAGIVGRWAARLAGAAAIIHTYHGFGFHNEQPRWVRRVFIWLEQLTSMVTDGVIVVSKANQRLGEALGLFGPPGTKGVDGRPPSILIRSGIDFSTFQSVESDRGADAARRRIELRTALGVATEAPVVLTVACLKPQKAPRDIIAVAGRVLCREPDAYFLIAGDGELRPELEALIRADGLQERVMLLGWRRDISRLLRAADLFLLTSRWEGLPRAILEALLAGLPVVATAVDGVTDVVHDGVNGYVVPVGDTKLMADRLVEILQSPELRRKMSVAASALPAEFEIHAMVRRQETLYTNVLRAKGVRIL
jgi:glycosyltransferase involved in cell wall biosynthesis